MVWTAKEWRMRNRHTCPALAGCSFLVCSLRTYLKDATQGCNPVFGASRLAHLPLIVGRQLNRSKVAVGVT